jgi:hypothetical protein
MTHDECTPTPEYMDCTCCEGCGEHVLGPVGSPDVTVYPCGACNAWGYLSTGLLPPNSAHGTVADIGHAYSQECISGAYHH